MKAEIISVGTELLLGQILNTDAQFLSQQLSTLGIDLYFHTVVGDNKKRLLQALRIAQNRADIIITTGGLGPTEDDLTKETVAEHLNLELTLHKKSLENIKLYFDKMGKRITDNIYKQAMFPEDAIILPNDYGTAPGFVLNDSDSLFIILPGPPSELKPMFIKYVKYKLDRISSKRIYTRLVKTYGIGESNVEDKLKDLFENQSNPTIAPLAGNGGVTIRITAKASSEKEAIKMMYPIIETIKDRLGDAVFGFNDDSLQSVVVNMLKEKGYTLSVAESCSGGHISDMLTGVPGVSDIFIEGLITYSNESKIKRLGVKLDTINQFGAVSEQTAKEMAQGVRLALNTDVGISVTGIAGPGGGTSKKPVGLVYIAIAYADKVRAREYHFTGNRSKIKDNSSYELLNWLRLSM